MNIINQPREDNGALDDLHGGNKLREASMAGMLHLVNWTGRNDRPWKLDETSEGGRILEGTRILH